MRPTSVPGAFSHRLGHNLPNRGHMPFRANARGQSTIRALILGGSSRVIAAEINLLQLTRSTTLFAEVKVGFLLIHKMESPVPRGEVLALTKSYRPPLGLHIRHWAGRLRPLGSRGWCERQRERSSSVKTGTGTQ